jgi:Domain of unknown function (DUF4129)
MNLFVSGLLIAAAAGTVSANPLPGPEEVRRAAREVLARPEFQPDAGPVVGEGLAEFFARLFIRAIASLVELFRWLHGMSPIFAWLFVSALVITLVLLLGHIGWTIAGLFRKDRDALRAYGAGSRKKVDPAELVRQAEAAQALGNYILGVRLLFRACLARLEQIEGKPLRLGATNREHLNRYRGTPIYDWLARFVSVIDLKWYGYEPCVAADFMACQEAFTRICTLAAGTGHAQRS